MAQGPKLDPQKTSFHNAAKYDSYIDLYFFGGPHNATNVAKLTEIVEIVVYFTSTRLLLMFEFAISPKGGQNIHNHCGEC